MSSTARITYTSGGPLLYTLLLLSTTRSNVVVVYSKKKGRRRRRERIKRELPENGFRAYTRREGLAQCGRSEAFAYIFLLLLSQTPPHQPETGNSPSLSLSIYFSCCFG